MRSICRLTICACLLSVAAGHAQTCTTTGSDAVSWWTGDCDAKDLQEINHGLLQHGALAGQSGQVLGAFAFDGIDDFVQVPFSSSLDFSGQDFAISLWFNLPSGLGDDAWSMLGKGGPYGNNGQGWTLTVDYRSGNKRIEALINNGSGLASRILVNTVTTGNVPVDVRDGSWHQLVVNFDRDSNGTMYLDGVLQQPVVVNISSKEIGSLGTHDLHLGLYGASLLRHWPGSLDEVQLFNRLLSAAEAAELATSAGTCKTANPCDDPPGCLDTPANLLSWWTGDCDATDILGVNNGILQNGVVAGIPGLVDGAFSFDGVDDYVQIPFDPTLDFTGLDFSVSTWIRLASTLTSVDGTYVSQGTPYGNNGKGWLINVTNTSVANFRIEAQINDGAGLSGLLYVNAVDNFNLPVDLRDDTWHHITVVFDRDSTGAIYLDGNLQQLVVSTIAGESGGDMGTSDVNLGKHGNTTVSPWPGDLDEFQIFTRALGPVEARDLFEADAYGVCKPANPCDEPPSCVAEPSDAVGWWPGDCDAADLIGSSDGLPQNGVGIGTPGVVDGAFSFDGVDDAVKIPNVPSLTFAGDFSVAAWINLPVALPDWGWTFVGSGGPFGNNGLGWLVGFDYRRAASHNEYWLNALINNGTDLAHQFFVNTYPLDLRDGQWHHIVAVYDRDAAGSLYLDGDLQASGDNGSFLEGGSLGTSDINTGQHGTSTVFRWQGGIDELMLFDRKLDTVEVRGIYDAQSFGVCKPCVPCDTILNDVYDGLCTAVASNQAASFAGLEALAATLAAAELGICNLHVCPADPGGADCAAFIAAAVAALSP